MNATEGLSDAELDIWADIFCEAKAAGVTEVTFSRFISHPFAYVGPVPEGTDQARKEKPRLVLAYSCDERPKS